MIRSVTRRQFVRKASITAGGLWFIGKAASFGQNNVSPNSRLNIGVIGTANRAAANIHEVRDENIVAICDVDEAFLNAARHKLPSTKAYSDYRKLLEQKDVEAVIVSTADHTHAVMTADALKSGRHVYCEKPLTHTVSEARLISQLAGRNRRLATQMGIQIHASENYRRVVELIQSGAIGAVKEVHVWVGTVYTAPGRPKETPAVPATLHWDQWLGPIPFEPYYPEYHPRWWRRYWAFGGGTLSDMGCHHIDLSHWALNLRAPISVEAEGPEQEPWAAPVWMIARYQYPARGSQPPVQLTWYQGEKDGKQVRPGYFARAGLPSWSNGTLFVGEKGMLLADYGRRLLLPEKQFAGFQPPAQTIAKSVGHHQEWINACKTGSATSCNFDYAGALTESVLLGNVAFRTGMKIDWDSANLKAKGCRDAEQYIQHKYRDGWVI